MLGADLCFRIKHYSNFRATWNTKVLTKLICIVFCLALIQASTITTGTALGKEYIAMSFYNVVDGAVIGTITFLKTKHCKNYENIKYPTKSVFVGFLNFKIKYANHDIVLHCYYNAHYSVYCTGNHSRSIK